MNDNPSPFSIHPDEQLEARLTAWVLGEASPFEVAELESLVAKSPELQLFLNRTRALHSLLQEAETSANQPDEDWKLPEEKRSKLSPILGEIPNLVPEKESRIRRASFRAAWGIAAVFTVTFFSLRLLPRDYEAEAVIEVKPRERTIDPLGGMSHARTMTPQFFATEFEKIKSRNSLEKVINNLDLTRKWNTDKETALKRLKESVETENLRGTDLIAIRVRLPDEQEAKEITRAVTEGYRDYRNSLEEIAAEKGIAALRKAVREQEDKVDERRKVLTTISRTKNIIYRGDRGATGPGESDESGIIAQRESKREALDRSIDTSDYADAKKDFETDLQLLEQMKFKLITEEISADLPNDSIVIHEDPAITGKSISNPLAALRKAITPEEKSSEPLALAEMAAAESSKDNAERAKAKEKTEIAGKARDTRPRITPPATAEPPAEMEKTIAAKADTPAVIPVPDIGVANSSTDFGDGDEFAGGFADNGLRSRDAAVNRNIDTILNNPEGTAVDGKPSARTASAPASEMSDLAQREILRRLSGIKEADENLLGGRDAYAKGDYGQAVEKYKDALQQLPDSSATADRRESYTDHLNDASIARATEFRKVGKYDEARELLKQAEASSPEDARIKEELAYLEDPIRTNPALTYEHTRQVDEVRRNLYKAQGNYDLGKFDDAKKAYEDTLRIDPYNQAARRGMEKIEAAKSDYYRAAYDHTRSELLMEVDKAWELEVPAEGRTADLSPPPQVKATKGADQDARAERLAEVDRAWELSVPADAADKKREKGEANEQADPFAAPGALNEQSPAFTGVWNSFESKESGKSRYAWEVGDASQKASAKAGEHPSQSELFFADSVFNANSTSGGWKVDASDHLTGFTGDLDGFVNYGAPIAGEPEQIDITTKHVEITQANDKELGFDWIVSPFSQKGNISSGTVIPVTPATPTDFKSYFESRITGGTLEVAPILGDIPLVGRLFQEKQPSLADLSQEIPAAQEPYSTFSLNISDASFQLALSAIEKGERPDPASIKPEQFYNAVDYGDPAPSSLEPVAAAIDQTAHPVIPGRNLVRVAIRTASTGRSAAQPLRLTLLVDQSGSMARADRRAAMDTALAQLATLLTENDRVTVIGFSRTPRLIADSLPGNEARKLPALINPTASEGGTNLEQALNLSSELALRHKLDGAQNRIVLFTDGAANLGDADPDRLAGRVKELRQQGLAFDIAGIGTDDTNDRLLSELSRHGNGRYYLVGENTGSSFAAQLAGAFRPAAENVKIQVKLNPERVGNYKLIGFEKDRLKTEDFRDDSVDAAELAADEAGVAIYQVETLPEGTGEIGEVSVRFRDTASGEMVERAWTIPHDPSTPAFDKAAPQTQLATLALLAAQKLQGGPLADAIRFPDHAETIAKLKQAHANDAKAQRLLTLIDALK